MGTGIVVGNGKVLTNAHVVGSTKNVILDSENGSREGTVAGTDGRYDIALIDSGTDGLPGVQWEDSTDLKLGQRVLAMGFALDLPGEPSLNSGVFAGWRRRDAVDYVQSDVRLNPGNSGGPLFTDCGKVVGINTLSNGRGISYSIVAEQARMRMGNLTDDTNLRVNEQYDDGINPVPAAESTPAPAACGALIDVVPGAPIQIGKTYRADEILNASLRYNAPGCTGAHAHFNGFFVPSSPRYQYMCVSPTIPGSSVICRPEGISGFLVSRDQALDPSQSGTITLPAEPGSYPPVSLRDPPDLEGFTLCQVDVTFHDPKIGGRFYEYVLGNWDALTGHC